MSTPRDWDPQVGDVVCDCRFRHLKIAKRNKDDVVLEDGFSCSLEYCCDPPDHAEPHPEGILRWTSKM